MSANGGELRSLLSLPRAQVRQRGTANPPVVCGGLARQALAGCSRWLAIEALARPRRILACGLRLLAMGRTPEFLRHPLWDAHPETILLGILAIAVAGGIWKLLAVAPLPGKLSRWGKKQIPAGECGLTEAQMDEASRDFSRTFGAPIPVDVQPYSALCLTSMVCGCLSLPLCHSASVCLSVGRQRPEV